MADGLPPLPTLEDTLPTLEDIRLLPLYLMPRPEEISVRDQAQAELRKADPGRVRRILTLNGLAPTVVPLFRHLVAEVFGVHDLEAGACRVRDWLMAEHGHSEPEAWAVPVDRLLCLLQDEVRRRRGTVGGHGGGGEKWITAKEAGTLTGVPLSQINKHAKKKSPPFRWRRSQRNDKSKLEVELLTFMDFILREKEREERAAENGSGVASRIAAARGQKEAGRRPD